MIEHISPESFIPLLFILPPILSGRKVPLVRRWFSGVDPAKFAYGAVTSGIILTFYGIWVGLAGFDVNNIDTSIPQLLEGLKTAFSSSLAGLTASMLINLFFVDSKEPEERSLEETVAELKALNSSLKSFTRDSAEANITALTKAINNVLNSLEMGINTETQEVMVKFRSSVETMVKWQVQYMEEIKSIIDAMDKNGEVTAETTKSLEEINDTLERLGPVTTQIADAIGYVQFALPSMRKRGIALEEQNPPQTQEEDGEK